MPCYLVSLFSPHPSHVTLGSPVRSLGHSPHKEAEHGWVGGKGAERVVSSAIVRWPLQPGEHKVDVSQLFKIPGLCRAGSGVRITGFKSLLAVRLRAGDLASLYV